MPNEGKELPRGAGILLPVSSLPSPYGIGALGKAAFAFIDFLKEAGQKYWQVLPVGPTSFGDSPYQSFSAFAGNPYFIDLDTLREEGLLERAEIDAFDWGTPRTMWIMRSFINPGSRCCGRLFREVATGIRRSIGRFVKRRPYGWRIMPCIWR